MAHPAGHPGPSRPPPAASPPAAIPANVMPGDAGGALAAAPRGAATSCRRAAALAAPAVSRRPP
jgi:hypothetical protein